MSTSRHSSPEQASNQRESQKPNRRLFEDLVEGHNPDQVQSIKKWRNIHHFTPAEAESHKQKFLEAYAKDPRPTEVAKQLDVSYTWFYQQRQTDAEFGADFDYISELHAQAWEDLVTDVGLRPEVYDKALMRPAWANLLMIRLKKLRPEYRDNFKVEVNVGLVTVEEQDKVARQVWEMKRKQEALEAEVIDVPALPAPADE